MLKKVLIANRGEIALRILRACTQLGLETVAVYSEADREQHYLDLATQSICIGPANAGKSYLNQSAIVAAARATGADAIHPGYGFLSENAGFAERVTEAGLHFIGPDARAIRTMGDKIRAKQAMLAAGVPCVPGWSDTLPGDSAELKAIAAQIGYPMIVKAAGGGGGRGMRVIREEGELEQAVAITREEARQAFGNPDLYLEKYLTYPRHIEIQVLADRHGNATWIGARDCSVQRRHQKVVEEAPPVGIADDAIAAVGDRCVRACQEIGYIGAGTFEFLYEDGAFSFIEMNTRIQVEHPVTELVWGMDLVLAQLRIAGGERLVPEHDGGAGHAIECRINAEDPQTGRPSPGTITQWRVPGGPGIRLDTHVGVGTVIPPYYDSLIAKVIGYGQTRGEALRRVRAALAEMRIGGVATNIPLLLRILDDALFQQGAVDIHFFETRIGNGGGIHA